MESNDTYENYTAFANLSCPTYSETDQFTIPFFQFWIEGVANVTIAALGLLANMVSALILCK